MEIKLDSKIQFIKGVGPKMAAKFQKLGVLTVLDLIHFYPRTYKDYSDITKIKDLGISKSEFLISNQIPNPNDQIPKTDQLINGLNNNYTISGNIVGINNKRTSRRRFTITEAVVEDGTGSIKVIWFNQPFLQKMFKAGSKVILNGKITRDPYSNILQMESPDRANRPMIVPIYPETAGITSRYIAKIVSSILYHVSSIEEYLPTNIIKENNLMGIDEAIKELHLPRNSQVLNEAKRRMAFDELFFIALKSQISRQEIKSEKAPILNIENKKLKEFTENLPYKLTDDQKRASWTIIKDMGDENSNIKIQKTNKSQKSNIKSDGILNQVQNDIFKKANSQKLRAESYTTPMNRLLNGDVGSGKTVVAAFASFVAVFSGKRVIIMAPTEILANQHYESFCEILKPFNITVGLLTSSQNKFQDTSYPTSLRLRGASKKQINTKLQITNEKSDGILNQVQDDNPKKSRSYKLQAEDADILIGTHAILHMKKQLENIGLVIVDEQHRFGVSQRAAIRKFQTSIFNDQKKSKLQLSNLKSDGIPRQAPTQSDDALMAGKQDDNPKKLKSYHLQPNIRPHFLSMTATPIPRTMQLALFGDLDVSIIREMPKGRIKIETEYVDEKHRTIKYQFIKNQVESGRQVFVICPLIEEAESSMLNADTLFDLDRKSVVKEYKKLNEEVFPNLKIGMLHGKLKPKEKDSIMSQFVNKKLDILVSTSVVEVGVDIANASVMMVEDAERFGLAQLHQFRGRVGRGEHRSYCLLFSSSKSPKSIERLRTLERVSDGFELAKEDLKTRGPGEIYGTMQSGDLDIRFADLSDATLISEASKNAKELVTNDPKLEKYEIIREKLSEFLDAKHLE